jgi:hypothetical protein
MQPCCEVGGLELQHMDLGDTGQPLMGSLSGLLELCTAQTGALENEAVSYQSQLVHFGFPGC